MASPTISPETRISVVEGEKVVSKPADVLNEGNILLGSRGTLSTLSDAISEGASSEEITYYGINDLIPFFSAGQPLWTNSGWRAIDADKAKKENPWLIVGRLSVGDCVFKLKPDVTSLENVEYDKIKITEFSSKVVSPGSLKLMMHPREGSRSFHGNGFLMVNNYPEFTSKRVADNVKKMSIKEKTKILKHLHELKPMIKKTFGFDATSYIKEKLHSDDPYLLSKLRGENSSVPCERAMVPLEKYSNVNLIDFKLFDCSSKYGKKGTEHTLPSVSLTNGHVFVDDKPADHSYIESNTAYWRRDLGSDKHEHGVLRLHAEGLSGQGSISITSDTSDHESECNGDKEDVIVFEACTTIKYDCQVDTNAPEFPFILEIGYEMNPDGNLQSVNRLLTKSRETPLPHLAVHLFNSGDEQLTAIINLSLSEHGYESAKVTWKDGFDSFDGIITTKENNTYSFSGVARESTSEVAMRGNSASLDHPCCAEIGTFVRDTSKLNFLVHAKSLASNGWPSVDELYNIPPPDDVAVQNKSQDKLFDWMKYQMQDDWMANILVEKKPDLSDSILDIINKSDNKTFLEGMGKAYLSRGLQSADKYKDKFTTGEVNKTLYYWAGDGKTSIGRQDAYNTLSSLSGSKAFQDLVSSTFLNYLDGAGGYTSKDWAKKVL
mmetsp:Transcript_27782/g.31932  ORF Transcript_27782/g.31932 Transcript_27782/m.31932 type:complete len:662 (+) Transcript_27782:127-2112(+)